MIFYQNYRKQYVNPYRQGVKIGNYNEDLYGKELVDRFSNQQPDPKGFVSESMDRYNWPKPNQSQVRVPKNEFTNTQNSNFDLNLDFSEQNIADYMKVKERAEYYLDDKNRFMPTEIVADDKLKQIEEPARNSNLNENIQKSLNQCHIKDTSGIFNIKKEGLANHLLFGHGPDQEGFKKNEYASTYYLTMSQKERTDKIFNPQYRIKEHQQKPVKERYDDSDWNFRNFKTYDNFTQYYDKKNVILRK